MLPLRTHMNAKSRNRVSPVTAQIRRLYLFIVIKMSTHIAGWPIYRRAQTLSMPPAFSGIKRSAHGML